jgi:hypothetical protein
MINLDMLGYYPLDEDEQTYPYCFSLIYRDVPDFVMIVSNYSSGHYANLLAHAINSSTVIKAETAKGPGWLSGLKSSDHLNFWEFGYPAILVTDTGPLRNKHYHKRSDTIGTIDFSKIQEVVEGVVTLILNYKE